MPEHYIFKVKKDGTQVQSHSVFKRSNDHKKEDINFVGCLCATCVISEFTFSQGDVLTKSSLSVSGYWRR